MGETLYWGTLDARLIAVDAKTGRKVWETVVVEEYEKGYALTVAPLIIKDKVIVGTAGGEFGIRGYLSAYDAATGEEAWRFYTIPGPGEPGHETWENDAWKTGGGSIWLTGSYDPELNLTYWGVGNPSPDWNPDVRPGDNLYTDSVIALDPDTGKLKWHFQFTPHDEWDWDAVQIPVLADLEWEGKLRKLMLWGNRNGFFYVLDRETGKFLLGKPFVKQDLGCRLGRGRSTGENPRHGPQPGRDQDVAGRAGRDELVRAFLQPAHEPLLPARMGGVLFGLLQMGPAVRARDSLPWGHSQESRVGYVSASLHELHGRGWIWRDSSAESAYGGNGLGVLDDRCNGLGAPHHREQRAIFR